MLATMKGITTSNLSIVSIVVIGLLIYGFYNGAQKGAVRSMKSLLSIAAGIIFTYPVCKILEQYCGSWLKTFISEHVFHALGVSPEAISLPSSIMSAMSLSAGNYLDRVVHLLCLVLAFTVIDIAFNIVLKLFVSIEQLPLIKTFGKVVGGIIGSLKMCAYIWIAQGVLLLLGSLGVTQAYGVVQSFLTEPAIAIIAAANPIMLFLKF